MSYGHYYLGENCKVSASRCLKAPTQDSLVAVFELQFSDPRCMTKITRNPDPQGTNKSHIREWVGGWY